MGPAVVRRRCLELTDRAHCRLAMSSLPDNNSDDPDIQPLNKLFQGASPMRSATPATALGSVEALGELLCESSTFRNRSLRNPGG
jgi:hypothetical protein